MKTSLENLKIAIEKACKEYEGNLDIEVEITDFWSQGGALKIVPSEEWPYNLIFNDDE